MIQTIFDLAPFCIAFSVIRIEITDLIEKCNFLMKANEWD